MSSRILTATLPPLMQHQFEQYVLLAQPTVIRSVTFRRDIVYKINRSSSIRDFAEYMERGVKTVLSYLESDPVGRVIVYTQSRGDADTLSDRLGCLVYYSDSGEAAEKEQVLQQEFDRKKEQHRSLMSLYHQSNCEYYEVVVDSYNDFREPQHRSGCRKCGYFSQAAGIKIQVHE
jgi:superfamily II DNA helicase RecQ